MASTPEHISMALFCDFENVALGVRDANYDKFDIKRVLERLLLKGSIVVKKAYCDWDRYKGFKSPMHEANFELIEIPHVRQSGKNSADIRLVVDALDLCYTKSHVNTFVIISGDSDFSPLVSKLRENAKYVIGVGVKQSTSDLLTANCDEFIFYDDLVRESQRNSARRDNRDNNQPRRTPEEEQRRRAEMDARRTKAVEMAAETYDALVTDRDEGGKIWASVLKEAIKRRNPGFNENYYGFRTFGNLLEEAQNRGLLEFGRDEKSSAYVTRGTGIPLAAKVESNPAPIASAEPASIDTGATSHAEPAVTEAPTASETSEAVSATSNANKRPSRRGGRQRNERHDRHERGRESVGQLNTDLPLPDATPAVVAPPVVSAVIESVQVATNQNEQSPQIDANPSTPAADAKPARPRRPRRPAGDAAAKKAASKTAKKTSTKTPDQAS